MTVESAQKLVQERYKSSFENFLGVKFLEYSNGRCKIELDVRDEFLNIGGTVHGGVINALCDIALSGAVTCNFTDQADTVVTMQMNVNFLRAGQPGDRLIAYGEVIKKGSTVVYVEGGIQNQKGKLLARASGDWFIKKNI
jgi:uncharacterized protein (TIGR00369 family)